MQQNSDERVALMRLTQTEFLAILISIDVRRGPDDLNRQGAKSQARNIDGSASELGDLGVFGG
jgi:hypothetical protein